ncbi:UNVERIFIED_CONTAM: hypothetical protein Sradi_3874700 [Sesamum radiatum]|uniref:Reverse transcriptase zinc-binding domain-containing protein n=1 Tax=Sesamum radiatum TaxID=300843 RepID=A0AAW2Q2E0_SESRA
MQSNLLSYGIQLEGECLYCDSLEDRLGYILRHCSVARLVWALSNVLWAVISWDDLSIEDWMRFIHQRLSPSGFVGFLLTAWLF